MRQTQKVALEPIVRIEEKISKEKYDEAVLILQKQEEAKAIIEKFEAEQRFTEDPVQEIIEKGNKSVISFEEIPGRNICRVTEYRYDFDGKSAFKKIEYLNKANDKNFLAIKNETIEML